MRRGLDPNKRRLLLIVALVVGLAGLSYGLWERFETQSAANPILDLLPPLALLIVTAIVWWQVGRKP